MGDAGDGNLGNGQMALALERRGGGETERGELLVVELTLPVLPSAGGAYIRTIPSRAPAGPRTSQPEK